MNHRELVAAQFNHRQTQPAPYRIEYEWPLVQKINNALGTEEWLAKKRDYFVVVSTFDTCNTYRPQPDGTQLDAYGSLWTANEIIAHLDRPAISGISPDDYKLPPPEAFCDEAKFAAMLAKLNEHPGLYPVAGLGGGIFELAWRLMGTEETLMMMVDEPAVMMRLFGRLTELLMQFTDIACRLPIEAISLGDDWADQRGIMFGAPRWREMIKPFYKKLFAHIHSKGKLVITHSCGSVRQVIPDLIDCGLDVLESLQPEAADMNPYELKREFGRDLALWGGLGCQQAVTFYSPEQLRDEIRRLRDEMSVGGGYILAPSKTLNISVPIENALAILDEFEAGSRGDTRV